MPNWCMNLLNVSGSVEDMDKWRVALPNEGDLHPVLTFDKLYPLPQEEKENWYDWQRMNWGTKWDIDSCYPSYASSDEYTYEFQTAWSPPTELIQNILHDFPGLCFDIYYYEPGGCFAGVMQFKDGEVKNTFTSDVGEVNAFGAQYFGAYPDGEDEFFEEEMF